MLKQAAGAVHHWPPGPRHSEAQLIWQALGGNILKFSWPDFNTGRVTGGHAKVLQRPVLYLSHYLKQHRSAYYDRLMALRYEGDWEGWLRFFLTGVAEVAREAEDTARRIVGLREGVRRAAQETGMSINTLKLIDHLFEQPIINVKAAQERLGVSFPAANAMVSELQTVGVLTEVTGGRRNRMFRFGPYLDLFADTAEIAGDGTEAQPTLS